MRGGWKGRGLHNRLDHGQAWLAMAVAMAGNLLCWLKSGADLHISGTAGVGRFLFQIISRRA